PNGGNFNSGSSVTVLVPTGWTTPQATNGLTPGYVSDVKNPSNSGGTVGTVTVSGNTITIPFTSTGNGEGFVLTYAGGGTMVTAPATAGSSTFTTSSKQGGGTLTAIASQPVVTVNASPSISSQPANQPVCSGSTATF